MSGIAGAQVARQYADTLGRKQTQPAGNMPPAVIGLTNDHALGTDAHVQTFEGVTDGDMRDLFWQANRQTDMHSEH